MEGLIRQAQETRRKAVEARAEAVRLRQESVELVQKVSVTRGRWYVMYKRTHREDGNQVLLAQIRRYVVIVGAMQAGGTALRRGDVVTNEFLRVDFQSLVAQRLLDPWDYRLSDLNSPGDPCDDGRWMG